MAQSIGRNRKNNIHVYLSDDEYEVFLDKLQESGLSISNYCRQKLTTGEVVAAPPIDFRKMIWELKRIGSNLDQVLFRLNSIGVYEKDDLQNCVNEIHGIVSTLYQACRSPGGR